MVILKGQLRTKLNVRDELLDLSSSNNRDLFDGRNFLGQCIPQHPVCGEYIMRIVNMLE